MQPGTRLGPYEIIEAIGRGGMGEVYRAVDTRLKRHIAIKILPAGSVDPEFRERFDREARAVAALSHPNIVAIHDVGVHDGIPYAAIELLEGDTLRSRIDGSPLPMATAIDYAAQIGRGLAADDLRTAIERLEQELARGWRQRLEGPARPGGQRIDSRESDVYRKRSGGSRPGLGSPFVQRAVRGPRLEQLPSRLGAAAGDEKCGLM